jgi:hypothetical protein
MDYYFIKDDATSLQTKIFDEKSLNSITIPHQQDTLANTKH